MPETCRDVGDGGAGGAAVQKDGKDGRVKRLCQDGLPMGSNLSLVRSETDIRQESLLNELDRQKIDLNARADLGTTDVEPLSPVSPTAGEAVCT